MAPVVNGNIKISLGKVTLAPPSSILIYQPKILSYNWLLKMIFSKDGKFHYIFRRNE